LRYTIEQPFKLTETFLDKYKYKQPPFGFNGLGEFVFMRTYSRIKDNGKNELWWETIKRVVEGIYNIQKEHIDKGNLGWNAMKAQKSAQEMYDLIFNIKFLPSGRALWALGSDVINKKRLAESLYNCSYVSTENIKEDPSFPFRYAMDMLMCGVGVGFDVRGEKTITIKKRSEKEEVYVVDDSREGWVESVSKTIMSFFGSTTPILDYSLIRPEGSLIKTFGGVASGSKPLEELNNSIVETLSKHEGLEISQRNIVDIFNFIGKAVVAGNVRRSAEIALGYNNEEFLNLKNYKMNPERESFGWASNNSVIADVGIDYSNIAERIRDNSEPGIIWLSNGKKFGRMRESEANNVDFRISGFNPCFSYESELLTDNGYLQIGSLDGKVVNIIDAEGNYQLGKVFKSGNKDTVKLRLSNKQSMICTPNHILKTKDGDLEAKNTKGKQLVPFLQYKQLDDTFVLYGYMQGDGGLSRLKSKSHLGVEILIGEKDDDLLPFFEKRKFVEHHGKQNRVFYIQDIKSELTDLQFSSEHLPQREFPLSYNEWNINKKASFLRGCFSANGSINNYARVTYKCTCKNFILQLQKTLKEDFDISSYITTNKSHDIKFSNGTYTVKESYDINIASFSEKVKFANEINFVQQYKIEKLHDQIVKTAPYVISIKENGKIDVYDFSLPEYHWGVVNGFIVHNCGEIGLESSELCNLVEVFPYRNESKDEFLRTLKYAYLFAKSITLIETSWVESNRVMMRNRRLGISVTGISQFISNRNISELKEWLKSGYNTLRNYDDVYSDWFAIPRSIKLTCVKPSGTLSLLGGATPGVHYPESQYYIRRVRLAKNSPLLKTLKNSGYKNEPAFGQEESTVVVEFPIFVGDKVRTQEDVSMWEQLAQAAFMQKYWSDNAVSVTITFDPETEGKDLERALDFYQYQLKGVSFLPRISSGAYKQMPYEKIDRETYEEMINKLLPLNFDSMVESSEAEMEKYCTNDVCSI
jgi:ribonucleotide reductase alpha subunit